MRIPKPPPAIVLFLLAPAIGELLSGSAPPLEFFNPKPLILYLDETGKYKSHEPEPVTITVKELGIKGWIKGER